MDQSPDTALGILQFLVANPVLLSGGINVLYLVLGLLAMRAVWSYLANSNATGQHFDIPEAFDKIHKDESGLPSAVVLAGFAIALGILAAAFIGG